MHLMRLCLLAAAVAAPATLSAQDDAHVPAAGWRARMDGSADTTVVLWAEGTGWHVNPERGGIWWNPEMVATGKFLVEAEILILPGSAATGVGIFIGGRDLDTDTPTYLTFVIRQDGYYTIALRDKKLYHEIAPWKHTYHVNGPGESPGRNVIQIEVNGSALAFFANGTREQYLYRSMVKPEGIVGLRVGGGTDAQVTRLTITPLD